MRSAILRAGSVVFAVTVLAGVVIHAGMSAGCTSEPRVQAEPPRATPQQAAPPPAEPSTQAQAAPVEPIVPTVKPQTKASPPPPPRFMPATKAAAVFRSEDLSQASPQPAPQQKASNAGNR